jgi:hypothetical protein
MFKHIGSWRCKDYWLVRGYTEEQAQEEIDKQQRKSSFFCIEFYTSRGFTEEYAKQEIFKLQQPNSLKSNKKRKFDYWLDLGYSEEDSKMNANKGSWRCIEYWLARGYTEEGKKLRNKMSDSVTLEYHIEKYGEVEGPVKYNERCLKNARPGELNGQFGKPVPIGSGRGISGYYNEHYFRSLYEYFTLKYFEQNNIKFSCNDLALSKNPLKISIKFQFEDKTYNYIPDFIINDKTIVEVKATWDLKQTKTIYKLKALEEFIEKSETYTDYKILTDKELNFDYALLKSDIDNNIVK